MMEEYRQHIVKMVEEIDDLQFLRSIYTFAKGKYERQTTQKEQQTGGKVS